tara:strand:+ start:7045 stop:7299 length:255 start_codon:yes stop_codon:yes gene_type:complete
MVEHEVAMAIHHLTRTEIVAAISWLHQAQDKMDAIRKEELYDKACEDIIANPKEWGELLGTPVRLIHEMYSDEEVVYFYKELTE